MKKLNLVLYFTFIMSVSLTYSQPTYITTPTIYTTTWIVSGSPYFIQTDITIPSGETLTIEPGVTVIFDNTTGYPFQMNVEGTLSAVGNSIIRIIFTPISALAGWKGIKFNNVSTSSTLQYCDIEYSIDGGIAITSCSSYINIINCNIWHNTSNNDGAGIYIYNSDPAITNCLISDNATTSDGGGIYIDGNSDSTFHITETIIDYNTADDGNGNGDGGGIYCSSSGITIDDNLTLVEFNNAGNNGGGIYAVGSDIQLNNIHLQGNVAINGGGIYLDAQSSTLFHNTIHTYNFASNNGGGIYCANSDLIIYENIIFNNTATNNGGGFYCLNSEPVINTNYIDWNSASYGGGLYIDESTDPHIFNNYSITNNTAWYDGGGIYINNSEPIIDNETNITDNVAWIMGGGIYVNNSEIEFQDLVLNANLGPTGGGGMYLNNVPNTSTIEDIEIFNGYYSSWGSGLYIDGGNPIIFDCHIHDNEGLYGAGIYIYNSNATISSCKIQDNQAEYDGAGIYLYTDDEYTSNIITIINNLITVNTATNNGGGMYLDVIDVPVINSNTIADNVANNPYGDAGGGIYSTTAIGGYVNNIIWGNTDINGTNSANSVLSDPSNNYPLFSYCDVEGCSGSGTGMFSFDPYFNTDQVPNDYRLHKYVPLSSPLLYNLCIDAGNDGATQEPVDLNGNSRQVNLIYIYPPPDPEIDLGAYEHSGNCPPDPYIFIPDKSLSISNTNEQFKITCYPNPATSDIFINFNLSQASEIQIDITSMQGKVMANFTGGIYSPNDYTLDCNVTQLAHGMYFIKFRINNEIHYLKFVKN